MTIAANAGIHPTAIVASGAEIGDAVSIGPYSTVGPEVRLGDGVRLDAHVNIEGDTVIGGGTRVFPFASLGTAPQDLKYNGERTRLEVGRNCMIREHVTMNTGTEGGGGLTSVGDQCLLMVGVHVAHDCKIGNQVICANNATIAGHVEIGDNAVLGGICAIHQFVRIGAHSMIGGMTGVERDVIPFGTVMGNRAALSGLNIVGMKRRGFEREAIHALRALYRDVFEGSAGALQERAEAALAILPEGPSPSRDVIAFILAGGSRRFCVPEA